MWTNEIYLAGVDEVVRLFGLTHVHFQESHPVSVVSENVNTRRQERKLLKQRRCFCRNVWADFDQFVSHNTFTDFGCFLIFQINELSHINVPVMLMPDDFKAHSKVRVDNHLFNKYVM